MPQSQDEYEPLLGHFPHAHDSITKQQKSSVPVEATGWTLVRIIGFPNLGSFLAAADVTMTTTMGLTMSKHFSSLSLIGWLGTSYLIANAAVQPVSGKLTDIFGRRTGLLFSCLAFLVGNMLCGLSTSSVWLIVGRAIAGIGGGGLNSICTFVASDVIPARRRGFWQGLGMLLFSTGLSLGGVFGGYMNESIGWRWAFLLMCLPTVVVAIGIFFAVPSSLPYGQASDISFGSRLRRVDLLGSFLLVASLTAFLFALDFENFNSGDALSRSKAVNNSHIVLAICLPLSILSLGLFVFHEWRTTNPIIAIPILANRSVLCASLAMGFLSAALYSTNFYVPVFFQARGESSGRTGLLLIPQAVGTAVGSLGSGLIMQLTGRYTYLKPAALLIYMCGIGGFVTTTWHTPVWVPELYLLGTGLGFGSMLTVTLVGMIAAIDHEMQAVSTGAMYAFRTVGASIGVSLSSALFHNVLNSSAAFPGKDLGNLPTGGCRTSTGSEVDGICGQYAQALRTVFLMAFGFSVATVGFGLLMPNVTLASSFHQTSSEDIRSEE